VCNILAEYAAKLPHESASEAYFKEHYEVMIENRALQNLAKI
jgi:adapter protein MecA 1/2